MSRHATLVAFASTLILTTTCPAEAQTAARHCAKRPDLINHLASKFHEAPVAMALTDDGHLLEVFASKDGETWTIAVTIPKGLTCLLATGQEWQSLPRIAQVGPPA